MDGRNEVLEIPHPNCYVVPSVRLIAGEYPFTPDSSTAKAMLCRCIDAGVTTFVDLTEAHELDPYEEALCEESRRRGVEFEYRRLSIPDLGVPTAERMREVLDAVDQALESERTVYLHCWGGIGRTGTVVGCYLVRRGASGDGALKQVADLFATMSPEKLRRHPEGSPQTVRQRAFVRTWAQEDPS